MRILGNVGAALGSLGAELEAHEGIGTGPIVVPGLAVWIVLRRESDRPDPYPVLAVIGRLADAFVAYRVIAAGVVGSAFGLVDVATVGRAVEPPLPAAGRSGDDQET